MFRRNLPKIKKLIPCGYCFEEWADCYDHIRPVSRGGTNKKSNLYPACKRCNSILSNKLFKNLDEKRNFIRAELKNREEWHSADQMQRMRERISAKETTSNILFEQMPLEIVGKEKSANSARKRICINCENCDTEFILKRKQGRDPQRFCSAKCRVAKWNELHPRMLSPHGPSKPA